jgi:hypothetical protein
VIVRADSLEQVLLSRIMVRAQHHRAEHDKYLARCIRNEVVEALNRGRRRG